jgi:hypothetical protein
MRGSVTRPRPYKPELKPMNRVLMLMALDLDPRYNYTDHELQTAWRRQVARVHPDRGGNAVTTAAVNASYMALVSRLEMPRPVDLSL